MPAAGGSRVARLQRYVSTRSHEGRSSGRELSKGRFGIAEPLPDWPIARPETLLVPLLAFDARGHRLGYGGGYYDRTIAALKAHGPLRTIGIAYAGQEVLSLPHDPHDQPLDAVLTENGLRSFNPES